jgi:hypothetical protein
LSHFVTFLLHEWKNSAKNFQEPNIIFFMDI